MERLTDDRLELTLRRVFAPVAVEPGPAELAMLARAVDEHNADTAAPVPTSRRSRVLTSRWRWFPAVALAGSTALGGTALALDGRMPAPLRGIAHAIGLPVHTSHGTASRELEQLRAALDRGDPAAIRAAAARLRAAISHLDPAARDKIAADAATLLTNADRLTTPPPVDTTADPEPAPSGQEPQIGPSAPDANPQTAEPDHASDIQDQPAPAAEPAPSDTTTTTDPPTAASEATTTTTPESTTTTDQTVNSTPTLDPTPDTPEAP